MTNLEAYALLKAKQGELNFPVSAVSENSNFDQWIDRQGAICKNYEGTPPLTFKSSGRDLRNYRIYGNTVDGESVGDLVTEGEHAGKYCIPVMITNGTDTQTTNIYLPEPLRTVGSEAEYVDYKEQKQHRVRKNLLENTATSQTMNGVIVTVNNDKSVSLSFESVEYTRFLEINNSVNVKVGDVLSGCPDIGVAGLELRINNSEKGKYISDTGTGATVNSTVDGSVRVMIRIPGQYANSNITFYPMLRKADIEDDTYEPYIENTELDVELPALLTLPGTNILYVETEVQPSKIEVKT